MFVRKRIVRENWICWANRCAALSFSKWSFISLSFFQYAFEDSFKIRQIHAIPKSFFKIPKDVPSVKQQNLKCVCLLSNVKFDAICHHQKFYHAPFFLSTYHYHIPKFAYAKLLTSNSQGQIVRRNLIFRIQNPPSFSLFRNLDLLSRLRPAHLRRKILISR